jgi:hypothetical protein
MQILGLLGVYFDASRSQEEFTFIQIGFGHFVHKIQ